MLNLVIRLCAPVQISNVPITSQLEPCPSSSRTPHRRLTSTACTAHLPAGSPASSAIELDCSDAVVEDACQTAWSKLAVQRRRVARESRSAWLATTALREALRDVAAHAERELLARGDARGAEGEPLRPAEADEPDERSSPSGCACERAPAPDRRASSASSGSRRSAAATPRSRRSAAARTRTVHRQLHRARRRLRRADGGAERALPRAAALAPPPLGGAQLALLRRALRTRTRSRRRAGRPRVAAGRVRRASRQM